MITSIHENIPHTSVKSNALPHITIRTCLIDRLLGEPRAGVAVHGPTPEANEHRAWRPAPRPVRRHLPHELSAGEEGHAKQGQGVAGAGARAAVVVVGVLLQVGDGG